MKFDDLKAIAEEVSELEVLSKYGGDVTIRYELNEEDHRRMDEELYYKTDAHKKGDELVYGDEIELTVYGVNFLFTKKES